MAEQHRPEKEAIDQSSDEINELQQLEEDVKLMAQKISDFRETLPAQLQNTLASVLSSQRPVNLKHSDNDPGPSPNLNPETQALANDDPAHTQKIQTIKHKISSSASARPTLLKRMKDCISKIEKLDSFNKGIHPAFKRRKMT